MVSTGCPLASVPLVVSVRILPSGDTTTVWLRVTLPSFLPTIVTVRASTRVRAAVACAPYGVVPVTGQRCYPRPHEIAHPRARPLAVTPGDRDRLADCAEGGLA